MTFAHRSGLRVVAAALTGFFVLATCGGHTETWNGDRGIDLCPGDPRLCDNGVVGTRCTVSDDCKDGVCCLTNGCGGGMCTFLCGTHSDCPPTMRCDGGFCFYACTTDANCGPGQHCSHDNTVCQY